MLNIKHPIIFLDVDGVLNSVQFTKTAKAHSSNLRLDPLCVNKLQRLVDQTDAVVVISSSWRLYDEDVYSLMCFFSDYAIPVIGMTESSAEGLRYKEIQKWLKTHYVIHDCYIAIDDDQYDVKQLQDHFIHTDLKVGLTDANVDEAVAVLAKYRPSLESASKLDTMHRIQALKQGLPKV